MPLTRAQRRTNRANERRTVPYGVPTEVLGQIYRQVDRPSAFGDVNSAFRGIRTDTHFEKIRAQRIIEDLIRRNGGKIFDGNPLTEHLTSTFITLFFEEYGCVIINDGDAEIGCLFGESIKHVTFKAVLGINTITNNPRFVRVGRFNLGTMNPTDTDTDISHIETPKAMLSGWFLDKLQQNNLNTTLKNDLIRTIKADLQNPCTKVVMRHVRSDVGLNYSELFADMLARVPDLENAERAVDDVIQAFFDPTVEETPVRENNAKVAGDTLEITVRFTYNYLGYWH